MKRGITDIIGAYRGSTPINKILRGTTLIWQLVVDAWANIVALAYEARVEADYGTVEDKTVLQAELELGTEQDYLDAIAIYNPNGGKKVGKIYDVRDTDNTSPNDLTVTGGGGTRFLADGTLETVPFEMPKIDYSTGQAAFLIEPARTNLMENVLNSAGGYNVTITLDQVGILGQPNTALKIETVGNSGNKAYASYFPNPTATHTHVFWIKKDQNETRFPILSVLNAANNSPSNVHLNTKTGEYNMTVNNNNTEVFVKGRKDWWEIVIIRNELTAVNGWRSQISPSYGSSLTSTSGSGLGSIILGHIGSYTGRVLNETPIITNGAVVTRTALSASITVPAGVTSIEEKVNGVVNTITTIPTTYTMPNGAVEYVKFL